MLTFGISMASCSEDIDVPKKELIPDSPGTVTLRFRNSERTRSQDSDNSETLIENLFIALYPLNADEESSQPVSVGTFSGLTDHTTSTVTMQLTDDMITGLFNDTDGASCRMYVLANLPAESAAKLSDKPTINEMKALEISAPFDTRALQTSFAMAGEGMVSYTAGTTPNDPGKASGSATVFRAAAKIRLNLNIPQSITVKNAEGVDETWIPQRTGIQCILSNGVKTAIANPVPTSSEDNPWKPKTNDAYYDGHLSNAESVRAITESGTGTYPWIMEVPFYTFPNAWEESKDETHKTTITLMVAWALQSSPNSYRTFYYQVPITSQELPHIDRNYSYNVNLTVGMLGSLVPEIPIVLDPVSYQVVNWSNESIDVNLQDFRYLVVNPNVITVNNEGEYEIQFYSSHPVDISNISMSFKRFNFYTGTTGEVVDITIPESKLNLSTYQHQVTENGVTSTVTDTICTFNVSYDSTKKQYSLTFKHPLEIWTPVNTAGTEVQLTNRSGQNNQTLTAVTNSIAKFVRPTNPEAPYSAYTFKLHIAHQGTAAASYYEDVEIIQYPAMFIEAKPNPGGGDSNKGNVWVNGANGTGGNYGGVHGISSNATNKNPNMYVINISQLDAGSEFIIGDPRSDNINNTLEADNSGAISANGNSAVATWDEETSALYYEGNNNPRHLSYYYPTEEGTQTSTKAKMVAPQIRIASSYGVTNALARNNARKRVAVYQEVDKPAGRWRLPTYSELLYIIRLSSAGKIPMLFNHYPDGNSSASYCYYWTAQGLYRVNSDASLTKVADNSRNGGYVKGVYDEWYWENSQYQLKAGTSGNYTYTLGDVPRGKQ